MEDRVYDSDARGPCSKRRIEAGDLLHRIQSHTPTDIGTNKIQPCQQGVCGTAPKKWITSEGGRYVIMHILELSTVSLVRALGLRIVLRVASQKERVDESNGWYQSLEKVTTGFDGNQVVYDLSEDLIKATTQGDMVPTRETGETEMQTQYRNKGTVEPRDIEAHLRAAGPRGKPKSVME